MNGRQLSTSFLIVCCSIFLLFSGCSSQQQQNGASATLKFTQGQSQTYLSVVENQRGIDYQGMEDKKSFKDSTNQSYIEMTFDQMIEGVDENGIATAKITINKLKYKSIYKNDTIIDFDSAKDKDQPLAKLLGKSYTIQINPQGKVVKVLDTKLVRAAVKQMPDRKAAVALFEKEIVENRHNIPALPDQPVKLKNGQTWNSKKTHSFNMMGSKTFDRIYTLDKIEKTDSDKVATITMQGIPAADDPKEAGEQNFMAKLFDNKINYTGNTTFNLTTGQLDSFSEELSSEWVAVDPAAVAQGSAKPDSLMMTASLKTSLKRID
jgi:hypothetical protein